ncbi:unnamed protein product [Protopolystoma xenopodis]|uniref:Uncharacterized protein n=1 Tax=Protopolystoma xenopodis TaxID=117903 RepID=A0A3S5FH48_9PLAT|nr:unnamed protein product [Protopolystoma xenopodis]
MPIVTPYPPNQRPTPTPTNVNINTNTVAGTCGHSSALPHSAILSDHSPRCHMICGPVPMTNAAANNMTSGSLRGQLNCGSTDSTVFTSEALTAYFSLAKQLTASAMLNAAAPLQASSGDKST